MLRRGKCMEFLEALKHSAKTKEEIKSISKLTEAQYQHARRILLSGGFIEKTTTKQKNGNGYILKYRKIK